MAFQLYIKDSNETITIEEVAFASGGEGELHKVIAPEKWKNFVAKIYYPKKRSTEKEGKINYLVKNPPFQERAHQHQPIIWPQQSIYNNKKEFVGFLMPLAKGRKLEILCAPKLPKQLSKEWKRLAFGHIDSARLRAKVCYNLAIAIDQIHSTEKYVLVDLKPDNILIQKNGLVSIVDIDSIEIVKEENTLFAATVATPDYTPPEYYNGVEPGRVSIQETWDRFSLAVIFYRLLLGIHPFAATSNPPFDQLNSLGDKIKEGLFVHGQSSKGLFKVIPPLHEDFKHLDEALQALFIETFIQGHQKPTSRASAATWAKTILNSSLLLVNRQLPSQILPPTLISSRDWYQKAVNHAVEESGLVLPSIDAITQQVENDSNNNEQQKSLFQITRTISKTIGIFLGALFLAMIIFRLIITGDIGEAISAPLDAISSILNNFGIGILVIFSVLGFSFFREYNKRGNKLAANFKARMPNNLAKRVKYLEDLQYQLSLKRSEIRQRIKKLQADLNFLELGKKKRESEFNSTYQKIILQANTKVSSTIQNKQNTIKALDINAQQLIHEEAQEIRSLRLKLSDKISVAPYNKIKGKIIEDKLRYINTSKDQNIAPEDIAFLQATYEEYQEEIARIQASYKIKHDLLETKMEQINKDLDQLTAKATQEVRNSTPIDKLLLTPRYKEILNNRNKITEESYREEIELKKIQESLREVREEIKKYR